MERRRFLALSGLGAAGALAGTKLGRPGSDPDEPTPVEDQPIPPEEIAPPSAGLQRVVWAVDTDEPVVALSFDDGPEPAYTPRVLEILDHFDVKATFMVMGYNATQHPAILRDIVDAGHEVGGHGWMHLNLREVSADEIRNEIERGNRAIEKVTGAPVQIFRPPYGRFNEATMRLLGEARQDLIVWSVTRGDLRWGDPRRIASHVAKELKPGGIVDLHDGLGRGTFNPNEEFTERIRARRETELRALPHMIRGIKEKGLHPRTVSETLAAWRPAHVGA